MSPIIDENILKFSKENLKPIKNDTNESIIFNTSTIEQIKVLNEKNNANINKFNGYNQLNGTIKTNLISGNRNTAHDEDNTMEVLCRKTKSDQNNNSKIISEEAIDPEDYYVKTVDYGTDYNFKRKIVWFNAIGFLVLHISALYGVWIGITSAKFLTLIWSSVFVLYSGLGTTVGAHRLYSHKSFKATKIIRIFLVIAQTLSGQNCLYIWVRDHRQHHKYSDTDADPHNASRGFFFSHVGWLMSKKHPMVIEKGKNIDMSDIEADKIVMFQKKYYKPLYAIFAFGIPVFVPIYFWNETYWNSLFVAYFARYIASLNFTWSVNSVAHLFGNRPYDKALLPAENWFVSLISAGEGWHNYHHVFPWDYRAAEFGLRYSLSTMFIDLLSKFNLVYDLKTASTPLVEKRSLRTGDGTHPKYNTTKDDNNNEKKD